MREQSVKEGSIVAAGLDEFVPVVDVSARHAGPPQRRALADSIGKACESSGFLVIVGHGIPADLIRSMYDVTMEFFLLPEDEKDRYAWSDTSRGFRRFGGYVSASIGVETPPDLCQIFTMGRFGEPHVADGVELGDDRANLTLPNVWPERPSGFRELWLSYYREMERLAADLVRLFAISLDLPEGFFDNKIDKHMTGMTANFYYPLATPPRPGQYRKGPHTDWGSLTILYQDAVGGLQVKHPEFGWRDVPYVPGSFVINLGDLMAEWTSHRWVSTMHRVVAPAVGGPHRLSIPFFHQPNYDAVIEPIFGPDASASDAEPITSGGWIARKMAAAYGPRAETEEEGRVGN